MASVKKSFMDISPIKKSFMDISPIKKSSMDISSIKSSMDISSIKSSMDISPIKKSFMDISPIKSSMNISPIKKSSKTFSKPILNNSPIKNPIKRLNSIANYKVIEKIGEGGFGIAYLVKDSSGKKFVLKKQKNSKLINSNLFLKEIFFLTKLSNTCKYNVCLVDSGIIEENNEIYFYIVMEYIKGISLEKYIKEHKMSSSEIDHLLTNLYKGIMEMGKKAIVHNDIKPDNIIINNKISKFLDYGLSCNVNNEYCKWGGTILYMSNEYIKKKKVTPEDVFAKDLYSLALTISLVVLNIPYIDYINNDIHNDLKQNGISEKIISKINNYISNEINKNKNISDYVKEFILAGLIKDKDIRLDQISVWLDKYKNLLV